MSEQMSLGEFIQILAAQLQLSNVTMPFQNERPWPELFYDLKEDVEARSKVDFLDDLRFDWNGPYPKSQELSSFLHALHCNASATANNPSYNTISLPTAIASHWRKQYAAPDISTEQVLQEAVKLARVKFASTAKLEPVLQ